jgi:hypothetical protein
MTARALQVSQPVSSKIVYQGRPFIFNRLLVTSALNGSMDSNPVSLTLAGQFIGLKHLFDPAILTILER